MTDGWPSPLPGIGAGAWQQRVNAGKERMSEEEMSDGSQAGDVNSAELRGVPHGLQEAGAGRVDASANERGDVRTIGVNDESQQAADSCETPGALRGNCDESDAGGPGEGEDPGKSSRPRGTLLSEEGSPGDRGSEALVDEDRRIVSRRAFLSGALTGGAVGLATAAVTGIGVYRTAEAQFQQSSREAEAELASLRGLLALYERQDQLGLDDILETGLSAMAVPLGVVERGAEALKTGLEQVEQRLRTLGEGLSRARVAFDWLEAGVAAVAGGIGKLQAAVAKATGKVADSPVGEALSGLLNDVLDLLPFGWGDKIRDAFDNLVTLLKSTDELVLGINSRVLEPLEQEWFSDQEGKGIGPAFLEPLATHVLDPLEAHLTALATLTDTWQGKLVAPAQQKVSERKKLQAEIARYRQEHGL